MAAAPLLLMINDRARAAALRERRCRSASRTRSTSAIIPVIVAGVGRFGHIVARLMRSNGFGATVLDHDAEQVETLRRFGIKSYYGDATRLDLLRTAGAERARLFVIAIDNEEQALRDRRSGARTLSRSCAFSRARRAGSTPTSCSGAACTTSIARRSAARSI